MSVDNAEQIAEICNFLFDDNITPAQVTPAVADVAAKAFHAALKASSAMNLVPRPTVRPGLSWLARQGVMAFWRSRGKRRIYIAAKRAAALKWRSAYTMAKMGI